MNQQWGKCQVGRDMIAQDRAVVCSTRQQCNELHFGTNGYLDFLLKQVVMLLAWFWAGVSSYFFLHHVLW
jgi:hypothetical protein